LMPVQWIWVMDTSSKKNVDSDDANEEASVFRTFRQDATRTVVSPNCAVQGVTERIKSIQVTGDAITELEGFVLISIHVRVG
jgi:hypothetical protein